MADINSNQILLFWQQQLSNCQGMMLNDRANQLDELEQKEIISYLPDLTGKKNLLVTPEKVNYLSILS